MGRFIIDVIVAFIIIFSISYFSILKGDKIGYERGYNKATYETTLECGSALHYVIEKDCSEIYELLKGDFINSRGQEIFEEERKKARKYKGQKKEYEKMLKRDMLYKKPLKKESYEGKLLSHLNHY